MYVYVEVPIHNFQVATAPVMVELNQVEDQADRVCLLGPPSGEVSNKTAIRKIILFSLQLLFSRSRRDRGMSYSGHPFTRFQ